MIIDDIFDVGIASSSQLKLFLINGDSASIHIITLATLLNIFSVIE